MTVTLPNGCIRTVDDSQPGAEMPIAFVTADGARPQTSTYDERPMPRYLPRPSASARRDSKLRVLRQLERAVERAGVVARVVGEADGGGVRELLDEVPAPHLGRVDAELVGDLVHQPLEAVGGLGPAGAAVGVGGRGVRERLVDRDRDVRDRVRARHHEQRQVRDGRRQQLQVGAVVLHAVELQREDRAVVVDGGLVRLPLVAAVDRGEDVLAAVLDPLHGRADGLRGRAEQELLAVAVQLRAEPAADVGRDHAHLRLGRLVDDGHERSHEVRHLRGRVQRDLAVRVTQSATQPRVSIAIGVIRWLKFCDFTIRGALREGLGEALRLVRERAAEVVESYSSCTRGAPASSAAAGVGDGGLRVVVDEHRVGGVARRVAVGGDHHRDRLAVVAHAALGEQRMPRLPGGAGRVRAARNAAGQAERLGRDDLDDAGHGRGRGGVDAADRRRARTGERTNAACSIPGSTRSST